MEIISRDHIDYMIEGTNLYDVVNYNEYVVLEVIRNIFKEEPNLCKCNLCIEDIYALSLNNIPPRYVQATGVLKYAGSSNFIDYKEVKNKVLEAILKVRKKPQHIKKNDHAV